MQVDILGVAPFVVVTAVATWVGGQFQHRHAMRKTELTHDEVMSAHKDDVMFQLLNAARSEMTATSAEIASLRDEVNTLRGLEVHFFHFQQALDHIEAMLRAKEPDERASAERAARAFLNRMRRLQDAKGTIANETQFVSSSQHETERKLGDGSDVEGSAS